MNATAIDLPEPLPIGFQFDGATIVDLVQVDEHDEYQPYLYALSNGETCWIPALDHYPLTALNESQRAAHLFKFDERFCGLVPDGTTRRVAANDADVTCPACRNAL